MEDQAFIYATGYQFNVNVDSMIFNVLGIIAAALAGVFLFQLMWITFYWAIRQIKHRTQMSQEEEASLNF